MHNWRSAKTLIRKSRQRATGRDATLSSGDGQLLTFVLNEGWTLTDYSANTLIARSQRSPPRTQSFSRQGPIWSEDQQCFVFVTKDEFCQLKLVSEGSVAGPALEIVEKPDAKLRNLRDISVHNNPALSLDTEDQNPQLKTWNWKTSEENRVGQRRRELGPPTVWP